MEIKPVFVTYEDEKIYNNISIWKIEKINIDSTLNELENNGKYKNVYLKIFYVELKLAIKNSNDVSEDEVHSVENNNLFIFVNKACSAFAYSNSKIKTQDQGKQYAWQCQ